MKDNALYGTVEVNEIGEDIHSGVLKDEEVIVRVNYPNDVIKRIKLRRIEFYDREQQQHFVFLSNLYEMRADLVAALYKLRWQIELLFYDKYIIMQSNLSTLISTVWQLKI